MEWQRIGLAPPETVLAATAQYLDGQDAVGAWLEECCDLDPESWASRADLYASWKSWAERMSEFVLPRARFNDALDARGLAPHRRNTGHGYYGLRLWEHDYGDATGTDNILPQEGRP